MLSTQLYYNRLYYNMLLAMKGLEYSTYIVNIKVLLDKLCLIKSQT